MPSKRLYTFKYDGSQFYGRSYHEKDFSLSPYSTEEDIKRIMAPSDSLRAYYPDSPSKTIVKGEKNDKEETARKIFHDVYNDHPYIDVKKNINSLFISTDSRFDRILSYYSLKVREKCDSLSLNYDEYFTDKIIYNFLTCEVNNAKVRVQRFRDKAFINKWDYFVTITYSDDKFSSEDEFRKALKIEFMNLHNRKGWEIMGVFERGRDNNRLHFHGFVYLNHQNIDFDLLPKKDWSVKHQKIHLHLESKQFLYRFGKNEFASLSFGNNSEDMRRAVDYCCKYINKDSEKFFYSRGIPSFLCFFYDGNSSLIIIGESVFFEGRHYYFSSFIVSIETVRLRE